MKILVSQEFKMMLMLLLLTIAAGLTMASEKAIKYPEPESSVAPITSADIFEIPDMTCPAGFSLATTFAQFPGFEEGSSKWDALIWDHRPIVDHTYTVMADTEALLIGFSVVGHPELNCPVGDHSYCSRDDQRNEHFDIYSTLSISSGIAQ